MSVYGFESETIRPEPTEKPDLFLGPRRETADRMTEDIKMAMATGRPCKMVIFGLYGIGKTHIAMYIRYLLRDQVTVFYLECPSCHRRSRFLELEQQMMRKVGKNEFIRLLRICFDKCDHDVVEVQNVLGIDADLAEVLQNGLEKDESLLWNYLLGQKITVTSQSTLASIKTQIDDLEASKILSVTAKLFRMYAGKKILFIVDEMEKTNPLTGDSITAYRDALRDLVDATNEVGIILISTATEISDFRLLASDPVKRRIGLHNIKHFRNYESDGDLRDIMTDVMKHQRRSDFSVKNELAKIKSSEKINEKTYPFTEKALTEIIESLHRLEDNAVEDIVVRPHEMLQLMDNCIAIAKEKKLRFIDSKVVEIAVSRFTEAVAPGVI